MVAARGTAFTYGPSHGQVLCEVLRRKLAARGETPFGYLRHKVLDPLGSGAVPHREDAQGNPAGRQRLPAHRAAMVEVRPDGVRPRHARPAA